ncbi:MAG: hypothetical protein WCX30_00005 [Candidatus Paceibacterota bacterium]|jgi:hypothetical protein|nr:hypothetical protein [bacterium]
MDQIKTNPNSKPKSNIFKFIFFIAVIVVVFGVILFLALYNDGKSSKIIKKEAEEKKEIFMTITGENKVQTYNSFIIDEWNGYRFKYRSDWSVKKDYDENGSFLGITLYPQSKKNDNDYITIGGGKINCEDAKMVKCLMAGYGLIMQPIYTYSGDTEVAAIYEGVVKSIDTFQGQSEFDIEKIRNVINTFIEAKKNNDFNKAKETMSVALLNIYDPKLFGSSGEGRIGRHEFAENAKYLNIGYYQVSTKVYAYLSEEKNEIGYWNYIFKIKIISNKYLIDNIVVDNFQSK